MNTTVTLLSAPGRSAIAVIGIAGVGASTTIGSLFRPVGGRPLDQRPVGRILYGEWKSSGEGVVVRRCGSNLWEIQSHGGAAAADSILADLIDAGSRRVAWQDWACRNHDSIGAQAAISLARAVTERTAGHLMAQQRGALRIALLEIAGQLQAGRPDIAVKGLERIVENSTWGLHLTNPWKVVFRGSPNVGKSSLANALLGYNRSIVYDRPGTTRDVLTATTAINGWPVEITDTAGTRAGADELEAEGIARARAAAASADLVIPVVDISRPLSDEDCQLIAEFGSEFIVANKVDVSAAADLSTLANRVILTSATAQMGISDLLAAIAAALVPREPDIEEPTLFVASQLELARQAINEVHRGEVESAIDLIECIINGRADANRTDPS